MPGDSVGLEADGLRGMAGEARDGRFPELVGGAVGGADANLPRTGEAEPDARGEFGAESGAPVTTEDEELGHIADVVLVFLDESEACPRAVEAGEEGIAARVGPIERELVVAEPAVFSDVGWDGFAEVMDVELEEVGEDVLMFEACWNEFESRGHCVIRLGGQGGFGEDAGLLRSRPAGRGLWFPTSQSRDMGHPGLCRLER